MQTDNDDALENNMLEQAESLDSDVVRNDEGDEVADPPEKWIAADDQRSLDERVAEEVPDVTPADVDPTGPEAGGSVVPLPGDQLDELEPDRHDRDRGRVDGTPEDDGSYYTIVD